MTTYEELGEIKIKQIDQSFIDKQRKINANLMGVDNAKLVAITLSFVTENDVLAGYTMRAKNFDETEWDD